MLMLLTWASTLVEQDHGIGAIIAKFHSTYGQDMQTKRALCRFLLTLIRPPPVDPYLRKCEARLAALSRRQPQKIGGYQMYKANVAQLVKSQCAGLEPLSRLHAQWQAFAETGKLYRLLPQAVKDKYQLQAQSVRRSKSMEILDEQAGLASSISLHRAREEEFAVAYGGYRSKVDAARWDATVIAKLQSLYENYDGFPTTEVNRLRLQAVAFAEAPSYNEQVDLVVPSMYSFMEACFSWQYVDAGIRY